MDRVESYTEDLIKEEMKFSLGDNEFGYVYPQGNVPNIKRIETLLQKAGGKPKECALDDFSLGGNGKAKPEFIITFKKYPNLIIVIEAKRKTKDHQTELYSKPQGYAVDGALYYAKFLKEAYDVIAIGVSGTTKEKARWDVYFWKQSASTFEHQERLTNNPLRPLAYVDAFNGEEIKKDYSLEEIKETAINFHNQLRTVSFTEKEKPLFIAGILIALENEDFRNSYRSLPSFKLITSNIENSIEEVLKGSEVLGSNIKNILSSFKVISSNTKLANISLSEDGSILWYIKELDGKIYPMMQKSNSTLDALGVFYHEFVKYSGGDGSGLGIVLTPQHLTEFMVELAEVNPSSKVIDICCGSGSFLVTAMQKMFNETQDPSVKEVIRKENLFGIELNHDLYLLALANMIIRKDGKSNLIKGDCFDEKVIADLKKRSKDGIDIGLLNPPYAQKDKEELEFVEQLLSLINKGGVVVVVVPMSCAIGTKFKATRKRLFEKHTLKAVFSMPNDIFYPTGTNTCVMVWEAHKPHNSEVKTFFGYYKEDGFVKRKKLGRVDYHDKWQGIKKEWLELYRNSEVVEGLSAKQAVKHSDEWLCEAYMETDYSQLTQEMFEQTLKNYVAYQVSK